MQQQLKANLPLVIGIGLPVVFMAIVAVFAFGPSWFVNPTHDFVYIDTSNDNWRVYLNTYVVTDGHIKLVSTGNSNVSENPRVSVLEAPKLYRYSVANNSVREIDLKTAQTLSLDPGPTSPDGYTIEYRAGYYGSFLFSGSSGNESGLYITKDGGGKRLKYLGSSGYSYRYGFQLLGWILK